MVCDPYLETLRCWQRTQPRGETLPLCLLPATHQASVLCQPSPDTSALLPLSSTRLGHTRFGHTRLMLLSFLTLLCLGILPPIPALCTLSGFLASSVFGGLVRAPPLPIASFTHQSLGASHVGLSYPGHWVGGSYGSSCLLPSVLTSSLDAESAWTFLELLSGGRETG